eukprot:TRINITY_DN1568_c0_g1_i12.p1 TRINITY_DN1568_c0_g1~~TRINITY_DN1568_c0_g1_i12.p1  ORF type:complete len:368 (+),score=22.18 TRINITY_DN1568_c0_g1_i12:121-1224(+)
MSLGKPCPLAIIHNNESNINSHENGPVDSQEKGRIAPPNLDDLHSVDIPKQDEGQSNDEDQKTTEIPLPKSSGKSKASKNWERSYLTELRLAILELECLKCKERLDSHISANQTFCTCHKFKKKNLENFYADLTIFIEFPGSIEKILQATSRYEDKEEVVMKYRNELHKTVRNLIIKGGLLSTNWKTLTSEPSKICRRYSIKQKTEQKKVEKMVRAASSQESTASKLNLVGNLNENPSPPSNQLSSKSLYSCFMSCLGAQLSQNFAQNLDEEISKYRKGDVSEVMPSTNRTNRFIETKPFEQQGIEQTPIEEASPQMNNQTQLISDPIYPSNSSEHECLKGYQLWNCVPLTETTQGEAPSNRRLLSD